MLVKDFKKLLSQKTGIPEDETRLIYGGKEFEDDRTLGYYPSIGTRATIFMVMRLDGGSSERMDRLPPSVERVKESCMIFHTDDETIRMPCKHCICPDALMDYCWNEIRMKKHKILCPLCSSEWPIHVLQKYGGADKEELHLLEEGLSLNYLDHADEEIKQCPECRSYTQRKDTSKNSMQCKICSKDKGRTYRFCYECLREWKNGSNEYICGNAECKARGEEHYRVLREAPLKKIEYVNLDCPSVRECPNSTCRSLVEHKKGCKHVVCKACRKEFCFICLRLKMNGSSPCGGYSTKCVLEKRQLPQGQ